MIEKLKHFLGLEPKSDYVKEYFFTSNMRAVIYMALIVVLLEIWMIVRLTRIVIRIWPKDFDWLFSHYRNYVILLTVGIIALVYAWRYIHGKAKSRTVGSLILWLFSFICIIFGIQVGVASYASGEQVLTFLTMTVFVFCILYWTPMQSLIFSAATFYGFFWLINNEIPATDATRINLFTMWISTFMIAMSAYHQKISEATKSENLEQMNAHLETISNQDELTGIANMRHFRPYAEVRMKQEQGLTFLYFDIENFKSYNEKYGYIKGNELLKRISTILTEQFSEDEVARFSDDHFVTLTHETGVKEKVSAAALRAELLDEEIRVSLKCGSCTPEMAGNNVSIACDHARIACNEIKRRYHDFYCVYDNALDTMVQRKQYVVNNIDNAIQYGWIKVYYQPVVKCANGHGELVGLEALARWDDPQFGLLPPYAFIETLEEYHEIHKLDQCIIEQVCQHLREDLDHGRKVVPVSLNFSRLDFELYDVPQYLHDIAVIYELPPNLLDVEITESALTDQLKQLQDNMARLRENQFSLWLDDFGSGYSSLNVLKDFSFDVLKIDMIFLRSFPANGKSQPIISSIVQLAKQLGMTTLCEGVETEEQFSFLQSIGCDKAQGYYFSKPLPREEILSRYLINSEGATK